MFLVSEKMSLATIILKIVVLRNVTALPRSLDGTWRQAVPQTGVSTTSTVDAACAINVQIVCNPPRILIWPAIRRRPRFRPVHGLLEGLGERCAYRLATALRERLAHRYADARATGPCPSQYAEPPSGLRRRAEVPSRSAQNYSSRNRDLRRLAERALWYRNEPLPVFDYKIAEQLISEGRTENLLRYVTSLEAGAAG